MARIIAGQPTATNAKSLKAKRFIEVAPGVIFRVRRVTIESLLVEGVIPAPLVSALETFESERKRIGDAIDPTATEPDKVKGLYEQMYAMFTSDAFKGMLNVARHIACAYIIEPKLTFSKKLAAENDEYLWVGGRSDIPGEDQAIETISDEVDAGILFNIFKSVTGEANLFVLSEDDAKKFLGEQPHADVEPIRDGNGSPSAPVGSDAVGVVADPAGADSPGEAPVTTDTAVGDPVLPA